MKFAGISEAKVLALEAALKRLEISEADLDERFVVGRGAGGQKVNKTSSAVQLKHLPTGIEVRCQKGRSQSQNRFFARRMLCEKLIERRGEGLSKSEKKAAKLRKQKQRRLRRNKAKAEPSS